MCEKNTSLARAGHGQSVPTVSSILTKLASAQMKKKDIYLIECKICLLRYISKRNEKEHLNPHAQMNKKYIPQLIQCIEEDQFSMECAGCPKKLL